MVRLKSLEFRRERVETWTELEGLLNRIDRKGIRSLTATELRRLPVLYRATVSSLSVARSISLDRNLMEYLEGLSARAYIYVYATRESVGATLGRLLRTAFPTTVRRLRWHILLSVLLLLGGTLAGFQLTRNEPDLYYALMPEALRGGRDPTATTAELREALYSPVEEGGKLAAFSALLFSNNTQVGFLAFALGFLAGLPTCLLVFHNGLILGVFAALYDSRGLSVELWGWLLPHGITELLAIAFCGAAGLKLGQALVFPGRRTRVAALASAGRRAGPLVGGAVLMFIVAALIEGVFRQTVMDVGARYLLAAATAAGWLTYFLLAGRRGG